MSRPGFSTTVPLVKLGEMLNSNFTGSGVLNTTSGQTIPHTGTHVGGGGFKRRKNKTGQTGGAMTVPGLWVDGWVAQDTEYMFISEIIALNQRFFWPDNFLLNWVEFENGRRDEAITFQDIISGFGEHFTVYEGMLVYLPVPEGGALYVCNTASLPCLRGDAAYHSVYNRWPIGPGWQCHRNTDTQSSAETILSSLGNYYIPGDGRSGINLIELTRLSRAEEEPVVKKFVNFLNDELSSRHLQVEQILQDPEATGEDLATVSSISSYGLVAEDADQIGNILQKKAFGTHPSELVKLATPLEMWRRAAERVVAQVHAARPFIEILDKIRSHNVVESTAVVGHVYGSEPAHLAQSLFTKEGTKIDNNSELTQSMVAELDIGEALALGSLKTLRCSRRITAADASDADDLAEQQIVQKHKIDMANMNLINNYVKPGQIDENEYKFLSMMSGIQQQNGEAILPHLELASQAAARAQAVATQALTAPPEQAEAAEAAVTQSAAEAAAAAAALYNIPGGFYKNLTNIVMSIDDAVYEGGLPPAEKVKSTILILANLQDNLLYLDWNEGSIPLEIQTSYLHEAVLVGGISVSQYCPLLEIYIMLSHKDDSSFWRFYNGRGSALQDWASTYYEAWYNVVVELLKLQPVGNFRKPPSREDFLSFFYDPSIRVALESLLPSM